MLPLKWWATAELESNDSYLIIITMSWPRGWFFSTWAGTTKTLIAAVKFSSSDWVDAPTTKQLLGGCGYCWVILRHGFQDRFITVWNTSTSTTTHATITGYSHNASILGGRRTTGLAIRRHACVACNMSWWSTLLFFLISKFLNHYREKNKV